jgi:hypothetical protein
MNKYNFRAIRRLARQIRERQSLMNSHQQSWWIILDSAGAMAESRPV